MAYILEHTHHLFDDDEVYKGVYRDNGIYVTNSLWSASKLRIWLRHFQLEVNQVFGSNSVQFTGVLWDANYADDEGEADTSGDIDLGGGISIATAASFTLLDMNIEWNEYGRL